MKDYFDDFGMQISEDVGTSSPSISPIQQDENPVLAFPSGSYYVSGHAQNFSDYSYYAPQAYHHSSLDTYPSLMYPNTSVDPPPLMLLDSSSNSIPSPTSTLSSSSVHNFAMGGPMYLNSTKDCPSYSSVFYYNEGNHHEDDHKDINEAPSCCSRANGSSNNKEKEVRTENAKSKETTGAGKKHSYNKRHTREKGKKRCSNCYSNNSPSWRRSVSALSKGDLLCNACGLYEKTAKKRRMLVTHEDGNTKVVRKRDAIDYHCTTCGVKNIARWRKQRGAIQCERCARRLKEV